MSQTPELKHIRSLDAYDFIDMGASYGNSLDAFQRRSGGTGLGVDNNEAKVRKAQNMSRNVVLGNAFDISEIPGQVGFVTCDNFLEHLPSFQDTDAVLGCAAAVARDFIYIRHPSFEDVEYLGSLGLKTFWTDWAVHPISLRIADLIGMLRAHGVMTIKTIPVMRIRDSNDPNILPLEAPPGQHHYKPEHGDKPHPAVEFERDVYYAYDIVGLLPGSSREMPVLEYRNRLGSERRPTFHPGAAEKYARRLETDIAALKSRKCYMLAEKISCFTSRLLNKRNINR
jgi:hypothetical protein